MMNWHCSFCPWSAWAFGARTLGSKMVLYKHVTHHASSYFLNLNYCFDKRSCLPRMTRTLTLGGELTWLFFPCSVRLDPHLSVIEYTKTVSGYMIYIYIYIYIYIIYILYIYILYIYYNTTLIQLYNYIQLVIKIYWLITYYSGHSNCIPKLLPHRLDSVGTRIPADRRPVSLASLENPQDLQMRSVGKHVVAT